VGVSEQFPVARYTPHHPKTSDEQLLTMCALKSIYRIFLTSCGMPVPRCWIGKYFTTEANILRVLLATNLMGITLCPAIHAAETKHIEGLDKLRLAELAFVAVCRISITGYRMSISGFRIWKKVPAETCVRRIVLATYCMCIAESFAVRGHTTHDAKRMKELLRTKETREAIGWILVARHSMLLFRHRIRKNDTTEAPVSRICFADPRMFISQLHCVLAKNAPRGAE
jgi:hypothetical protein